ncbi:hypothetical protein BJX61DRAFT_539538 [Aspergillus egyptiacus]|nr:hypothetical protein BJX61DRAFT_539538 [Aspergillus egyptiacus]
MDHDNGDNEEKERRDKGKKPMRPESPISYPPVSGQEILTDPSAAESSKVNTSPKESSEELVPRPSSPAMSLKTALRESAGTTSGLAQGVTLGQVRQSGQRPEIPEFVTSFGLADSELIQSNQRSSSAAKPEKDADTSRRDESMAWNLDRRLTMSDPGRHSGAAEFV